MPIKPYDHTTYPTNGALGSSSALRNELDNIEAGFDMVATEIETALTGATGAATTATTKAAEALTSANNSATSASQALTSKNAAATSATNAATSATNAAASATAVANTYDAFDDRYLGTKAAAPTLDNDGAALQQGSLYWDSTLKTLRGYNGAAWVSLPATTAVNIVNTPSGNLAASNVQAALNELQADIDTRATTAELTAHIDDTTDAHDATAISTVPSGNLTSTNVGAALNELQTDVNTRATTTALTAHTGSATGAHAATAISTVASGNLTSTNVGAALNELQTDVDTRALNSALTTTNTNLSNHLADTVDAHAATAISTVASGNLTATNVQAALNELQTDINTRELSINAATAKVTPVDADTMGLIDSAASFVLKKITLSNLKAFLFGSAALTGTPTAPTATAGTNTTQIATTEFVLANGGFPAGTRMPFAMASAPTGWTQDTSDNATNRMLRVVNTTGNGVGGSHSPILNNVVPAHTHGFTTGNMSADHSHGIGDPGHAHSYTTVGSSKAQSSTSGQSTDAAAATTGAAGTGIWTGGVSANHTHSGSTDNGSSQTNWTPRYIDMIICAKN